MRDSDPATRSDLSSGAATPQWPRLTIAPGTIDVDHYLGCGCRVRRQLMAWWMESDTFADDAVWEVLAGGNADRVDQLQAAYCRIKATAAHLMSDGYLTEQTALRYARGRKVLLERLATPVLQRPPLLHRPGDECECLDDAWIDGYAYRIHAFLKRNPSRTEHQRHHAQKADLRDPRLKALVYERDGGCCRYCRTGPLSPKAGRARDRRKVLVYDHVDPDAPAGPDGANLVTSCGRCNEHKGRRTPYEADMVLLPPPTPAEKAAWQARGLALFDPADHAPDHRPITDESATNQCSAADPDQRHDADPNTAATAEPDTDPTPPAHPENTDHQQEQPPPWSGKGVGAGRGGHPGVGGDPHGPDRPAQPTRTPSDPDVYHRRSRAPSTTPPAPDYAWPPGAVPATEPRNQPS